MTEMLRRDQLWGFRAASTQGVLFDPGVGAFYPLLE